MHSGMIGKIEKARRYAEERARFEVSTMTVTVHGNNGDHQVRLQDGAWECQCEFFRTARTCAHTMALELILDGMVREQPEAVPEPVAV